MARFVQTGGAHEIFPFIRSAYRTEADEPGSAGGSALYFPAGGSTGGKGAAGCYRDRRGYL